MTNKDEVKSKKSKKAVKAQDEAVVLTADLQRLQADFVNFRNRAEEERAQAVGLGKSSVIQDLLPVLDNLDRALNATPVHNPVNSVGESKDSELEKIIQETNDWLKWKVGIEAIHKQLLAKLKELGIEKILTVGKEFNAETMEAVAVGGEGAQEIVSEELQSGYMYCDQVLRAAMVKVTRK